MPDAPEIEPPSPATPLNADAAGKPLRFRVLGRTLEHFGVQMYKRRDVAIAELVANCWDAGAKLVEITLPAVNTYDPAVSQISIFDSGFGMTKQQVQDAYLVLGRNRRREGGVSVDVPEDGDIPKKVQRRVMGRKGIGKLAGFGIARKMTVATWCEGTGLEFYLNLDELKAEDNDSTEVEIEWKLIAPRTDLSNTGTLITLSVLKHKTSVNEDALRRSLARRFSRTVRGQMEIKVNTFGLPDPTPALDKRMPEKPGEFLTHTLPGGGTVRYWYGFASAPVHERELRGFAILVHGKVAQAPPYFFDVEAKASGQHATRYVVGDIEADFIDDGSDDESDLVSTDRQEIDWEAEPVLPLKSWGETFVRRTLIECTEFRGAETEKKILAETAFRERIERLDPTSQKQIRGFLKILGTRSDADNVNDLADSLIRAYEFRQFHDVINDIERASDDGDRLALVLHELGQWKVLESRALLEIVRGRLGILDKFEKMLVNDAPETKSSISLDNMHDLLAGNPWLLNPEWQILAEEKAITTQLREWGAKDYDAAYKGRYDFLALASDGMLVLLELKRPGLAAELEEIQRLQSYAHKLATAHPRPIKRVFICGMAPNVAPEVLDGIMKDPSFEMRYWKTLFKRTRDVYEHYRALLEGSVGLPGFMVKEEELRRTRSFLETGVHRTAADRAAGVPPSDMPGPPQA